MSRLVSAKAVAGTRRTVGAGWENQVMSDSRFTTPATDADHLLTLLDLDEIADVETLLMSLYARPIEVRPVWDDAHEVDTLEVIVHNHPLSYGSYLEWPVTVQEIAREYAYTIAAVGPYEREDGEPSEEPDVLAMDDDELTDALRYSLGDVRLFNLLADDD